MKEYEDADTLERRDSVDHYLTARGEVMQTSSCQFSESTPSTDTKRTNPPIITFNPNERLKYRKPSTKKTPAPKPKAGSVPPPSLVEKEAVLPASPSVQNVHSDMYSTVFALQSLGDGGTWPSYLSHVRTLWDDKLHQMGTNELEFAEIASGRVHGQGHARSDQGQY